MATTRIENLRIERARLEDLEAITAIYNHEVTTGVATFDTEPRGEREARLWFEEHASDEHPLLVARADGVVAGWASLSQWSPRGAYSRTVEGSVFVHHGHRGRGIGAHLLAEIARAARAARHRVILGRIEAGNDASRRMLLAGDFRSVGIMHAVGEKFGRVLDVEVFELVLDSGAPM